MSATVCVFGFKENKLINFDDCRDKSFAKIKSPFHYGREPVHEKSFTIGFF